MSINQTERKRSSRPLGVCNSPSTTNRVPNGDVSISTTSFSLAKVRKSFARIIQDSEVYPKRFKTWAFVLPRGCSSERRYSLSFDSEMTASSAQGSFMDPPKEGERLGIYTIGIQEVIHLGKVDRAIEEPPCQGRLPFRR